MPAHMPVPASNACAPHMGDKRLLFDDEREAFVMYQVRGRSWVAMGDPVGGEKGFSLGRFDPLYLRRFPCALVRRDDDIVGFANDWASGRRQELSAKLVRHRPDAPPEVMDFLFTDLMPWDAPARATAASTWAWPRLPGWKRTRWRRCGIVWAP